MNDKKSLVLMTPDSVAQELLEGNLRFVKNQRINRNSLKEIENCAKNQYPFAIVLGCVDSRVPIEILFDQGVGDLFVTRIAGNIENNDIIASMEYACEVVGSKLIMVLGHENCGAVSAACDDVKIGYITDLLARIKPAIAKTPIKGIVSSNNKKCVDDVAKTNVVLTIARIREKSTILNNLEKKGTIKIVGAFFSMTTGKVKILEL